MATYLQRRLRPSDLSLSPRQDDCILLCDVPRQGCVKYTFVTKNYTFYYAAIHEFDENLLLQS